MEGAAHIIVGSTGTGKTTFTKKLLSGIKQRIFIYDINNEYTEFYTGKFLPFSEFMEMVKPVKNSIIIFEEATIFLNHKNTNSILIEKLVRKRHENNYIILNFHSLRKIPIYILDMVNYLTMFKTLDSDKFIQSKFEGFVNIPEKFDTLKKSENKHINTTFKLY